MHVRLSVYACPSAYNTSGIMTTHCSAVTGGGSVDSAAIKPVELASSAHCNIVILIYLLTYIKVKCR